ncbi:MAG: carboxypeptidase-like regulatory domain-containing protein [Bacteroidia bacterium]
MRYILALLAILSLGFSNAQNTKRQPIQFSGVIVDGDSLAPIPFTTIIVRGSNRGTIADYYGYFSFVAQKGDTIDFSSVGYKSAYFVIPDSLDENRYSLIQMLFTDTILLRETVIYPWPTKEQFREAFLNLNAPDDDFQRAMKNLAIADMRERANTTPNDGSMAYKQTMNQYQSKLYSAGQAPTISLLNPVAWAKFVQAWRAGELSRKKQ